MNILMTIMLLFFGAGVIDVITGRHMGLADGFERGIAQAGSLGMSIVGIYCIGITVVREYIEHLGDFLNQLPFDGSVITSMILAPDLGGYPLAKEIAASPELVVFSGFLVSGGLGCLISFQLPIALTVIKKEDIPKMMQGLMPGIMGIPAGLLAGGFWLGMDAGTVFVHLMPVVFVCLILILGTMRWPEGIQRFLSGFGMMIRGLSLILTALVIFDLFYEPVQFVSDALVKEALVIAFKITAVVCGGLTLSDVILKYCRRGIEACAVKLHMNTYAIVGLLLSLISAIAMLPLFEKMDDRGKMANAAFSVMGAYVLGGQMAFVATLSSAEHLLVYMGGKLIAGAAALLITCRMSKRQKGLHDALK